MAGPATGSLLGSSGRVAVEAQIGNEKRKTNFGSGTVVTKEVELPNGSIYFEGYLTEAMTLHTSGTTKDTTALLPAGTCDVVVCHRVTTSITTATTVGFGTAQSGTAFSGAWAGMTAGDTGVGGGMVADITTQASTFAIRVTTSGTPGAGAIRIVAYFRGIRPPTS
jgi:hypothetical protein